MDLLLLGAGMGIVGGILPNPLQMIALTQVALGRWARAIFVIIVPPLIVDGCLLLVTIFFYRFIPPNIAHSVAYVGGVVLLGFAGYSLWELHHKTRDEMEHSATLTYAGVTVATLAEVAAPGTWIYWMTVAGPILGEARVHGYGHVVPFFVGGLVGYYGAAVSSTCLMAWGAGLHKRFKQHLILIANILLLFMGMSYLVRAYLGR
jgi:uncharacterized membrane protein YqgA involved in biofilm formation